jgi:ribonuclease D
MNEINLLQGDLDIYLYNLAFSSPTIAWDIETSGLDWQKGEIGSCQIFIPGHGVTIVKVKPGLRPDLLLEVLASSATTKIFHHAMFDLRWMAGHWGVVPQNIECTKIASKILTRDASSNRMHSLKYLLQNELGITLDKSMQQSDWLQEELDMAQLHYAADDVLHLLSLLSALQEKLQFSNLLEMYKRCTSFVPTRVAIEVGGWSDVFDY